MGRKFNLTAEEIYNQSFHVDLQGYSSKEVDEFLDLVISDYQKYDEMISELGNHLQTYEAENKRLQQELASLKSNLKEVDDNSGLIYDNLDIIKRISNLEKEVFKK